MIKHFQYFNFAIGGLARELIIIRLLEFLDGHVNIILDIPALEDHPVGTLPDSRHDLILVHLLI